jgi:nitroreductase
MNIFETIKNRRSIGKMTEQRPERKQIERILEAATHAPNHHKVEPWKFFVLAGQSRIELGNVMARSLAERLGDATNVTLNAETIVSSSLTGISQSLSDSTNVTLSAAKGLAMLNKERNKLLRSPVVLIAAAEHPQQPNVLAIENIEAVAAAVQNMLLVAEEMGLAAMWRTGDASYDPHIKQWLGLAPEDHIVAFIYLGFPAIQKLERRPTSFEEKTTWLDWNE